MSQFDQKVDDYIAVSEDFAKPVLNYLRELVHNCCPQVTETMKWSLPHFAYRGDSMFLMAAYTNYCSFAFLKAGLMSDPRIRNARDLKPTQRYMGKITSLSDLPDEQELIAFINEAMILNEMGVKITIPKSPKIVVPGTPEDLQKLLDENPKAKDIFESKSDSFRKEYILWIDSAKTDFTRQKRLNEAIEWMSEGKNRFWKYAKQ